MGGYVRMKNETKRITMIGMLTAMAVAVTLLVRFPLVPAVSFLQYDPKDIVIMIGGFLLGPVSGAVISCLASLIELLFKGGTVIDVVMNIVSTCSFVCPAAYVYKKRHTRKGALQGLVTGVLCNVLVMLLWNYVMTPIYFGMPREAVVPMLGWIALFNFLKAGINSIIVFLIYKPVARALRLMTNEDKETEKEKKLAHVLLACFIAVCVLIFGLSLFHII